MRLQWFVAAFMMFWLGGVSVGVVTFLTATMRGKMEPIPALLIPLGMLIFGIAMTSGCFWWEAKKTKPFLVEILKGTEQQPTRE
jgi:ABC-type iron transport system FetAB permease component